MVSYHSVSLIKDSKQKSDLLTLGVLKKIFKVTFFLRIFGPLKRNYELFSKNNKNSQNFKEYSFEEQCFQYNRFYSK